MGIKAFNHGDDFVNKFVRAIVSDSTGLDAVSLAPEPSGLTATGGIISEYTDPGPGAVYRAHIFTNSDTFQVTALGTLGNTIDYLMVGGGRLVLEAESGGGGGGGGVRTFTDQPVTVTISVIIGGWWCWWKRTR